LVTAGPLLASGVLFEVADAQFQIDGVVQPVAEREQGADNAQPHALVAGVEHGDEPIGSARHVLGEPPDGLGDEVGPHLRDKLPERGVGEPAMRGRPPDPCLLRRGEDVGPRGEGEGKRNIFFACSKVFHFVPPSRM